MSSAFMRSTIEVRHSSFSPLCAATALSTIAATSTVCAGAADGEAEGAADGAEAEGAEAEGAPPEVAPPAGAAAAGWLPKIALTILPKMLMSAPRKGSVGRAVRC